jgi:hypothetical protein
MSGWRRRAGKVWLFRTVVEALSRREVDNIDGVGDGGIMLR